MGDTGGSVLCLSHFKTHLVVVCIKKLKDWGENHYRVSGRHLFTAIVIWREIRQSTIYYDGLLGRWDKRIVDQESDVPSIIFFYTFYRLNVCFIKDRSKLNSVLLLCLLRIFMKQTLVDPFFQNGRKFLPWLQNVF